MFSAERDKTKSRETARELIARTPEPKQPRGGRDATEEVIQGVAALAVNDPGTEAPPGWCWVPLVRIARQESGHTPSRGHPEYWGGDIPWISIRDAGAHHGGPIFDTNEYVTELGIANSSARILPAGSVCLSRTASVGYVTVMGRPMATSQDFVTWTCTPALLPEFLKYALMAEGDNVRAFGKGSTHTTIYFPEIRALHICLPPLHEQHQIVAWVEALIARTRRARMDLQLVTSHSVKYREKLLLAAMLGKLTDSWREGRTETEDAESLIRATAASMQPRGGRDATDEIIPGSGALSVNDPGTEPPPGWLWTPLLRIARQESGHTPSRNHPEYWGGEVPWIAIRDAGAHHGRTIHDTMQKPTMLGIENSSARLLPAGTVCLSRTASVGYVTVMGCPMATSQDFVTWTCTPALLPDFLKYALMAEGDEIRRFGKGSTHTTIYFPEIRALHICLPPLAEQKEIVARLDRALAAAELVELESTRALALLDRLEQSILTRAFRGELVPQEQADKAAAVALKRVAITKQEKPRRSLKGTAAA